MYTYLNSVCLKCCRKPYQYILDLFELLMTNSCKKGRDVISYMTLIARTSQSYCDVNVTTSVAMLHSFLLYSFIIKHVKHKAFESLQPLGNFGSSRDFPGVLGKAPGRCGQRHPRKSPSTYENGRAAPSLAIACKLDNLTNISCY